MGGGVACPHGLEQRGLGGRDGGWPLGDGARCGRAGRGVAALAAVQLADGGEVANRAATSRLQPEYVPHRHVLVVDAAQAPHEARHADLHDHL